MITVTEFVAETNEDYKAPTTSNFSTRMSHCRNAVAALEEVGHARARARTIGAAGKGSGLYQNMERKLLFVPLSSNVMHFEAV